MTLNSYLPRLKELKLVNFPVNILNKIKRPPEFLFIGYVEYYTKYKEYFNLSDLQDLTKTLNCNRLRIDISSHPSFPINNF